MVWAVLQRVYRAPESKTQFPGEFSTKNTETVSVKPSSHLVTPPKRLGLSAVSVPPDNPYQAPACARPRARSNSFTFLPEVLSLFSVSVSDSGYLTWQSWSSGVEEALSQLL